MYIPHHLPNIFHELYFTKWIQILEFPSWFRGIRLVSMGTRVRSLVSLSGLRIWRCHEVQCNLQTHLKSGIAVAVLWASSYSSDSTPSLGTSIWHWWNPKKKKKKSINQIQILCRKESKKVEKNNIS